MEKKKLLKWTKGLLALVLAFLVLLGNGMDVFAATYKLNTRRSSSLELNAIVCGGDVIELGRYDNLYLNGRPCANGGESYTFPGDTNDKYIFYTKEQEGDGSTHVYNHYFKNYIAPETEPAASPVAQPIENDTGHEHSYEWVEAFEPSVSGDGLMQHRCSCGAVDDQYTIPGSLAYFRMFCAAIQNAPENGTVEWNPYAFRCYTRRMMEELAKRPDVTLRTTYTEADGTTKSFTIPAGQALTDEELFYGFTYLGNLYGWN
ncbi:MAG: hypothetical protein Q4E29_05635 [Lachnospiraceae bacterium]|nr:hypothetical protein [Lachnospiraceae bacterium]